MFGHVALADTAVYCIAGVGTPVGLGGGEIVQGIGSMFEMTVGVGIGLAATASGATLPNMLQWAAMPRLHLGDRSNALTIGAGVSGGGVRDLYVVWANIEVGSEVMSPDGWAFRYFFGYGHGFASGDSFNIPYAGVGIGRFF